MDATKARKITAQYSKRMEYIYNKIEESAKRGQSEAKLLAGEVNAQEREILIEKGFTVEGKNAHEDGYPFTLVSW